MMHTLSIHRHDDLYFILLEFVSKIFFVVDVAVNGIEGSWWSSHTHGNMDEYTRHHTGLLDETKTATELGESNNFPSHLYDVTFSLRTQRGD